MADPMIGKPVNILAGSQYIEISFAFLKPDTAILGGTVVWVINNRVMLRYEIPPQNTVREREDSSRIWIRDLRAGVAQLQEIEKKEAKQPVGSPN